MDQVRQWWGSYQFQGSPRYVLANKLKALKTDLKKWNVESFGNVAVKKTQFWTSLAKLDNMTEGCPLTVDKKLENERTVEELEKMILLEEISHHNCYLFVMTSCVIVKM